MLTDALAAWGLCGAKAARNFVMQSHDFAGQRS